MSEGVISMSSLIPLEKNPRKISPDAMSRLCDSIERDPQFMTLRQIIVDKNNIIIAGNQRYRACEQLGMKSIPASWVVVAKDLTEEQRQRFILIDNSPEGISGTWDFGLLATEWKLPMLADVGINISPFVPEIDLSGGFGSTAGMAGRSQVLRLEDNVRFDGAGPFDLPMLREDMMLMESDTPVLYEPRKQQEGLIFWNYGSDSPNTLDWKRCVVGFYVEDERFECWWAQTAHYVDQMLGRGIVGMVSPNYSCYYNFPCALRIWNIFRSRWIARFAQEAGIKVIPDISGAPADINWVFDGLPQGCHVSIQVHRETQKTAWEKNTVIAECIKRVKPTRLWIYGQQEKQAWYPALAEQDCRWISPRTVAMLRRIRGGRKDGKAEE